MLYLRLLAVWIWFVVSFAFGVFLAPFRWGDTSLNRFVSGLFGRGVLKLLGIRLEIEGLEDLEKHQPCVYVANHQGALDIATFGSFYPHRTVVIGKKELQYFPVLNLYMFAAGNIFIDRSKRRSAFASLEKAVRAIHGKGASVWIFPEGTRNRTDQPILPLKKGAFHMSVEAQVPIVPVISGPIDGLIDVKNGRSGGVLRVKVLPPIPTRGLKMSDVDRLAAQVREKMIEAVRGLSA